MKKFIILLMIHSKSGQGATVLQTRSGQYDYIVPKDKIKMQDHDE